VVETGQQLIAYSRTAISKAASIHLAKGLAKTLAPDVTVNAVAPGLMLTDWAAGFIQEQLDAIEQASALKRHITVEDVADVYCWSSCLAKRALNGSERSDAGPEPIYHGDCLRLDGWHHGLTGRTGSSHRSQRREWPVICNRSTSGKHEQRIVSLAPRRQESRTTPNILPARTSTTDDCESYGLTGTANPRNDQDCPDQHATAGDSGTASRRSIHRDRRWRDLHP
jgi:hypothetical protein